MFNKLTVARRHIKAGEKRELELKQEKQSAIGKATDLRRATDLQSEKLAALDVQVMALQLMVKVLTASAEEMGVAGTPDGLPAADLQQVNNTMEMYAEGKYTARARILCYQLLRRGVPAHQLGATIAELAPLFGVELTSDRAGRIVPSAKAGRVMMQERGIITHQLVGRRLADCPEGQATAAGDAGSVRHSHGYGVGAQVPSSEGLGALPNNLPILIQPIEDGRAVTEFNAWKQAHGELLEAINHLARTLKERGVEAADSIEVKPPSPCCVLLSADCCLCSCK